MSDDELGPPQRRTDPIHVEPIIGDAELFAWLEELFYASPSSGSFPERIELRVVKGRYLDVFGPRIDQRTFAPESSEEARKKLPPKTPGRSGKPTKEELVHLANSFSLQMRRDCDVQNKSVAYGLFAWHMARGDEPYSRLIRRMKPTGVYSREHDGGRAQDDDDDSNSATTKLLLGLLDSERRDKRWMSELMASTVSGALERADARLERVETMIDSSWAKQIEYMKSIEANLSNAVERQLKVDQQRWRQQKADWALDQAAGIATFLLPALAKKVAGAAPDAPNPAMQFLTSMSAEEGAVAFGSASEDRETVSGGIFSNAQWQSLLRVARSSEPDDATVSSLVDSLTGEQIAQAQALFAVERLMPVIQWLHARRATPGP